MDKEKNILSDEELGLAAGGLGGQKNVGVHDNDSCDNFSPSGICRMFGGSYDKICKNCKSYMPIHNIETGTSTSGHCLLGRENF